MKCIFCLEEKPEDELSEEHVFPEAVGGIYKINSVCKPCNDRLGHQVDHHLTNNWLVASHRFILRIRGKSKTIPNPIENGVLKDNPSHRLKYLFDDDGHPQDLYTVPNVEKKKLENGSEVIKLTIDEKDREKIPIIVNKIRKRSGLPALTQEEQDELLKTPSTLIPNVWMEINAEFDLIHYKRSILKIVYELAWDWIGDAYLNDTNAELMRQCIFDKELAGDWSQKYPIRGDIGFVGNQARLNMWLNEPNSHIALMIRERNRIGCYVRVFNVIDGIISVTENANLYPRFEGEFLSIDTVTGNMRRSTFIEEAKRLGGISDRFIA